MTLLQRGTGFCVATVFVITAFVAGCTPPWSSFEAKDPLAIQGTSSGGVEALLVPCSPVRVTRFEVIDGADNAQKTDVPRLWQVDFSPPTTDLRRVVLGQVPPGGTEQVQWPAAGLDGQDHGYVMQVGLESGEYWIQGFHQRDLTGGRVLFHNKLITPEAFAGQSRCTQPTSQNR